MFYKAMAADINEMSLGEQGLDTECILNERLEKDKFENVVRRTGSPSKEPEKKIILHKGGKRPRGRPRKIMELVPAATKSSSYSSSLSLYSDDDDDDDVVDDNDDNKDQKVKPGPSAGELQPVPQEKVQIVAKQEPVKKECGRKALPPELKALKQRKLLKKTKKTKELSEQLRDKVVERHSSGEGYKRISKSLDIPLSTVRAIIQKWKLYHTTQTLPRSGRPSKLTPEKGQLKSVGWPSTHNSWEPKDIILDPGLLTTFHMGEQERKTLSKCGKRPRGQPRKIVELVAAVTKPRSSLSSSSEADDDDDVIKDKKVKPDPSTCEPHTVPQENTQIVVAKQELVHKKPQSQGTPQTPIGSPNGQQTTKKTKELSEHLRANVVERHSSGEGYKKISKSLNIPLGTVRSIIQKWKMYGTTQTLPRSGRPSKLTTEKGQVKRSRQPSMEQEKKTMLHKGGKRPRGRPRKILELVPAATKSINSYSLSLSSDGDVIVDDEDDDVVVDDNKDQKVKPGPSAGELQPVPQEKVQIVANQEPVKKNRGRKALPPELKALKQRKLLKKTKKTKELSEQLRDKVVEKHLSGEGYKKISKSLDIPLSTVRAIIQKWKVYRTTRTLPRSGCPSKLSSRARRKLVREATVRPTVTLKELQSSLAEMGINVHESTISRSLHNAGLYSSVARRKTQTQHNASSSQHDPNSQVWWEDYVMGMLLNSRGWEASQD